MHSGEMSQRNQENPPDGDGHKGNAEPANRAGQAAHPILPELKRWAQCSEPPLIPFQPTSQFKQRLIASAFHDHAKRQILITRQSAAIISMVLCGQYDRAIHELVYRAAQHRLGFALCQATFMAHRTGRQMFATFSLSTHLPDFLEALETWAHKFWPNKDFDWKTELPWINRNLVGKDETASEFWLKECLTVSSDTHAFTRELAAEVIKADAAKRMRDKRGTTRQPPKFKDDILVMWIAGALWCRDTAGILFLLEPKSPDAVAAHKRIDRDISELGLSASRRPDHQRSIDEAEKNDPM